MPSLCLSTDSVASVKKALQTEYQDVGSSRLSECLAAALGFRTHAALRAALQQYKSDPPVVFLSNERFEARMRELCSIETEQLFGLTESTSIIQTFNINRSASEPEYKTRRQKAWRNVMVCCINEAIRQKWISVLPGDNRWPGGSPGEYNGSDTAHFFKFVLPNGMACEGYLRDIGQHELEVKMAISPRKDWHYYGGYGGRYAHGPVWAMSWLERDRGAWLQSADTMFSCKRALLEELASLNIEPNGYGDRGLIA